MLSVLFLCVFLSSSPDIVLTEVMANAIDEDTGEFIELFNVSKQPLDLSGWTLTDGDSTDQLQPFQGDSLVLSPGQFALILDSEYAGEYEIPAETLLITTGNTTIGNGLSTNDPITIFNAEGEPVATFHHPFNPGNGVSAEIVSIEAGDTPDNWRPSIDPKGATPGMPNSVWNKAVEDQPISGKVIISELMIAPDTKQRHPEWIELQNLSMETVYLRGCHLADSTGKPCYLSDAAFILPLGYLVLTRSLADFHDWFPDVPAIEVKLPSLNNDGDTISLIAGSGEIIDSVSYERWQERDRSLERLSATVSANDPNNWHISVSKSGSTPGEPNSVSNAPGWEKISLSVNPRSFDPALTAAKVIYEVPLESRATIRIFNSAGRLLLVLADRELSGGHQEIDWDGRDRRGNIPKTGLYLCQLIAESSDGEMPATKIVPFVIRRNEDR